VVLYDLTVFKIGIIAQQKKLHRHKPGAFALVGIIEEVDMEAEDRGRKKFCEVVSHIKVRLSQMHFRISPKPL